MALRGQVHDRVGAVLLQNAIEGGAVADVDLLENMARGTCHRGQ